MTDRRDFDSVPADYPDWSWAGPPRGEGTVFGIRRDESGTDENHFDVFAEHWSGPVFVATGGICAPLAPYYSFNQDPWERPDNPWPRRFHLFPRLDQAARVVREARYRARDAWLILRHGHDEDDW